MQHHNGRCRCYLILCVEIGFTNSLPQGIYCISIAFYVFPIIHFQFGKVMKCGPSNKWKVEKRQSFQNFGKLIKSFGNMAFLISFQMFNVIGNPNIFPM